MSFPLLLSLAVLCKAAGWQEQHIGRLVATDIAYLEGPPLEPDDSAHVEPYERQVRRNVRYLKRRGVTVEDGWNLFEAYRMWGERFPSLPTPATIILAGTWNNTPSRVFDRPWQTAIPGRQFLGLSIEALKAQFPDATILAVNAVRHLNLTTGHMGYVGYPLKTGHGIDMLKFPKLTPSREPLGIGMVATGRTSLLQSFVVQDQDVTSPNATRDAFDLMAYLRAVLTSGQWILQLGANRFQLMVRFLDYMDAHSWEPLPRPFGHVTLPASGTPLPVRVTCGCGRGAPRQRTKTKPEVHCSVEPFTFPELTQAFGATVDAAFAWLDAVPAGLLGGPGNAQPLSCNALQQELRRSRSVEGSQARSERRPSTLCTVYMGSNNGSHPSYRDAAFQLGRVLAQHGIGLVYGGSNVGLMGAVADGALEGDGYVIGVRPEGNVLTAEHQHQSVSELILTKDMHERKQVMVDLADFIVALPGGLGTLDELADALVLGHLRLRNKRMFALNINQFWAPILRLFEMMETADFLQVGRWTELLEITDSVEALAAKLHELGGRDTAQAVECEDQTEDSLPVTLLQSAAVLSTATLSSTEPEDQTVRALCSLGPGALPAVAASATTTVLVAFVGVSTMSASSAQCIRDLLMLVSVLAASARMISVPDSNALSLAVGRGAAWSGLYLGIAKWGDVLGNLACALPMNRPNSWRESSRAAMLCALAVMAAGSCFCMLLLKNVSGGMRGDRAAALLCASRAIMGVGNGMVTQLVILLLSKLTPQEQLPSEFQRAVFYVTVGTGLGPLAAAAAYSLDCSSHTEAAPRFEVVGVVQLILLLGALSAVAFFFPSSIDSEDDEATPVAKERGHKRSVVIAGLMLCALRSFVAGSVEVSTPMLLQHKFGWGIVSAGLITGAAFLPGLPIRLAYLRVGRLLSDAAWVRLFTISAVCGTGLLFTAPGKLLPRGIALAVGDMIIFPSVYLGEGLTQGMMMQHVDHDSSSHFFTANSITLVMDMIINACLGLGAVAARKIVAAGGQRGQDLNAGVDMFCCVAFLIIFEMGMRRHDGKQESF